MEKFMLKWEFQVIPQWMEDFRGAAGNVQRYSSLVELSREVVHAAKRQPEKHQRLLQLLLIAMQDFQPFLQSLQAFVDNSKPLDDCSGICRFTTDVLMLCARYQLGTRFSNAHDKLSKVLWHWSEAYSARIKLLNLKAEERQKTQPGSSTAAEPCSSATAELSSGSAAAPGSNLAAALGSSAAAEPSSSTAAEPSSSLAAQPGRSTMRLQAARRSAPAPGLQDAGVCQQLLQAIADVSQLMNKQLWQASSLLVELICVMTQRDLFEYEMQGEVARVLRELLAAEQQQQAEEFAALRVAWQLPRDPAEDDSD